MVVATRNPLPLPPIQFEERRWRPLRWEGYYPGWQNTVCTNCRLNMHHTLASVRWDCRLHGPLRPRHSLDLSLSAIYTHGPEDFPAKSDFIRQPETVGLPTWRLLKNKRHDPSVVPYNVDQLGMPDHGALEFGAPGRGDGAPLVPHDPQYPRCVDPSHPLRYGGLLERRNPYNIRLGISSHHSPQSNNGFSRNSYGAFYTA